MDKGIYNSQEHMNHDDENQTIEHFSETGDNTPDTDRNSFINDENMNIVSMKDDNEVGEFQTMDLKDSKLNLYMKKSIKVIKTGSKKLYDHWNGYVDISKSNLIYPILYFILTMVYLELVLHLINYRGIDFDIIYPILFAIPLGILLGIVTGLFTPVMNRILTWVFTAIMCLIFAVQLIYYYIFTVYFSFQSLGMAGDAVSEFFKDIITAMKANVFGLILVFFPLVALGLLINQIVDYKKRGLKLQVILLGTTGIFHVVALTALLLCGKEDYSPYDLYHKANVMDLCGKELGITTMTRKDIVNLFGGGDDLALADAVSIQTDIVPAPTVTVTNVPEVTEVIAIPKVTQEPTPIPIDTSPNVMDIDFNALAENEEDSTIRTLDQYFASVTPTNKNEYTGMFQGYNLILLTAEGFSPFAVDQNKTPTLYKLTHEGFIFNNFYTPLWQTSTSDGEYCALNGIIPTGIRNMYRGRKNLWPFSLANQFNKLGVVSKAYHDNTYTYYERNETHPNLGYLFKAKGNGLELEHPNYWPESDLEMINSTVDEYINEDQFHVYYMTVSGHMNYTFTGNMMSYKNKALVEDLPYSEDVKAYIACQIELDRALEQLITKLEEAGVADRTVIALSADHYPYAWDKSIIDEAAGHEVDPDFEIYKNYFILWNEGMKDNIVIDKPCSSLDILPTLSNLFGLEYDSRLLMGQDILSNSAPLVMLSNRSFITDKVMYNSKNGKITKLTNEELVQDYISNMNKIVKNKFAVSESILKEDYYRHIFGKSNE